MSDTPDSVVLTYTPTRIQTRVQPEDSADQTLDHPGE